MTGMMGLAGVTGLTGVVGTFPVGAMDATQATQENLTVGGTLVISWDTVTLGTLTSNTTYTVPTAGNYMLATNMSIGANLPGGSGTQFNVNINVDGIAVRTGIITAQNYSGTTATLGFWQVGTRVIKTLAVGQAVTVSIVAGGETATAYITDSQSTFDAFRVS